MKSDSIVPDRTKRLFGWIGLSTLLLIIPAKAARWADQPFVTSTIIGIAPSVLGPAGLLFLMLSSTSPRLTRLTLLQTTVLVGAIAMGLEFIQLAPRPGILAVLHYTFDWLDVAASLSSVSIGYVVARIIIQSKARSGNCNPCTGLGVTEPIVKGGEESPPAKRQRDAGS